MRQIIGWREFINGIYWLRGPDYRELNSLGAERPLPAWFYTAEVPMNCLHHVLRQTLDWGWNHHIQRLMVLGNFMLLAGIRPQEALRWFSEMYVDAYDWVMSANVIGMICHADGGYMATKPYAASGAYIASHERLLRGLPAFARRSKPAPKRAPSTISTGTSSICTRIALQTTHACGCPCRAGLGGVNRRRRRCVHPLTTFWKSTFPPGSPPEHASNRIPA